MIDFSNGKKLDGLHLRVDMAARDQVVSFIITSQINCLAKVD